MATNPLQILEWHNNGKIDLHGKAQPVKGIFIGSREHPDSMVDDRLSRRVIGRVFNLLIQLINRLDVNDTQCGFKLYPADIAKPIFSGLKDLGWAHDVEVLQGAKQTQADIVELPVRWQAVEGSKIVPAFDAFPMLLSLLKLELASFLGKKRIHYPVKTDSKGGLYRWASAGLFFFIAGIICFIFQDFGVTWDEPYLNQYGHLVVRYYSSLFEDKSVLTFLNLYLYGGLFDSIAAVLQKLSPFGHFETRHFLNALVGFLGIIGTWKLANILAGNRAAFLAALMLFLVPSYFGHMFNNPKDIPFAAGYVWSLYYLFSSLRYLPRIPNGLILKLGVAIGLTLGVRVGGLILLGYFALAASAYCAFPDWFSSQSSRINRPMNWLKPLIKSLTGVIVIAYILMLIFWPWGQQSPLANPLKAMLLISNFDWDGYVLLGGEYVKSTSLPVTYLPLYFLFKMPELVLVSLGIGVVIGAWFLINRKLEGQKLKVVTYLILMFSIFFPLFYVILKKSVIYDGIRHFLFIVPLLCVICGITLNKMAYVIEQKTFRSKLLTVTFLFIALLPQIYAIIQLHPNQYVYYNKYAGGIKGANGFYEMDYWANSYKEAVELTVDYLKKTEGNKFQTREYLINVNGPVDSASYYFPDNFKATEHVDKADFFISFTRWDRHHLVSGNQVAAVKRMGVELSVVKDLRRSK
jgi:hypothetical protein